jgi:hypothetical protein
MNFKRPCWLAMYVTFGMLLLGYFGFLSTVSYWADKAAAGWWWPLIAVSIDLLMALGAVGFVFSLIWCFVEAIASRADSDHPKN